MTDLVTTSRTGKRERLVASAFELFHHEGVERTTLAHIAQAADVQLGNVYYYFKTKDDIVAAVIEQHEVQLRTVLSRLDRHREPRSRLAGLIREIAGMAGTVADHGCPDGTLCVELDKRDGQLAEAAGNLMRMRIDWVREQFRLMGRRDAQELALALVSGLQGASLLANALGDPAVLTGQARHLQRWISALE